MTCPPDTTSGRRWLSAGLRGQDTRLNQELQAQHRRRRQPADSRNPYTAAQNWLCARLISRDARTPVAPIRQERFSGSTLRSCAKWASGDWGDRTERRCTGRSLIGDTSPLCDMAGCSCAVRRQVRVSAESACENMHKAFPRKRGGCGGQPQDNPRQLLSGAKCPPMLRTARPPLTGSRLLRVRALKGHEAISGPWLQGISLAVFFLGLALAVWARVYLGRNWGMPMSQKADPELVTTGPYRSIRSGCSP